MIGQAMLRMRSATSRSATRNRPRASRQSIGVAMMIGRAGRFGRHRWGFVLAGRAISAGVSLAGGSGRRILASIGTTASEAADFRPRWREVGLKSSGFGSISTSLEAVVPIHGADQPKHLRKMVEGHLCRIMVVCVVKASIRENLLTTFLY
jgi:hypothetical protein